jgi:ribosome-associated heat shock protein Hsp15
MRDNRTMETLRLDKFLWAARFFKTRALAADACDLGRIDCNGHRAKPARDIRPGDKLRITNEAGTFEIEVLELSAVRGPAAVAHTLYRESPESRAAREALAAERKEMLAAGGLTESRPSKRDRRDLAKLRGRIHRF